MKPRHLTAAALTLSLAAAPLFAESSNSPDAPPPVLIGPGGPAPAPRPGPGDRTEKGPYLGVSASSAPASLRHQVQLPAGVGLVVDFISAKSPADEAGLKQFDLLHKLNDQLLINPQQLAVLVRTFKPGDEVTLAIIRDGKPQTLTLRLAEKDLRPLELLQFGWMPNDPEMERIRARMEQMRAGIPQGAPFPEALGGGPGPVGLVGPADAQLHADAITAGFDDGKMSFRYSRVDGREHLVAKEKSGPDGEEKTIFDGPIDTPEQLDSLPKPLREKLDRLRNQVHLNGGGPTARPLGAEHHEPLTD